jgi:hypothetical protein
MGYHWPMLRWFVTPENPTSSSELEVKHELCSFLRMDPVLTIGEVSRRSGVASSALRFYEERGLISSVRAGSGHRRYPRSVLRRIAFIVFAQKVGLALEEIAADLPSFPRIVFRLAETGRAFLAHGQNASIKGSLSFNVSERG